MITSKVNKKRIIYENNRREKMIMKKLLVLLSLCLLTSCVHQSADSPTSGIQTPTEELSENTAAGQAPEESAEIIVVDQASPNDTPVQKSSLGDVSFTSDIKKAVTRVVPVGKELTITVLDATGAEWTLTVPAHAVPAGTQITMKPLDSIQSGSYPCTMTGGIILEPDGLTFDKCGTLSVKMVNDVPSIMLTGNGEGKDLLFMDSKQGDGIVSASIAHFSTTYFQPTDDPKMKDILKDAQMDYESALENVKEMLKQTIEVVPPPTIKLECYSEVKREQARDYAKQALEPEYSTLLVMLDHAKKMFLLGSETVAAESFKYGDKVYQRLLRKADGIFSESKKDPDKFLATSLAVATIYNMAANFGVQVPPPGETLGAYAQKTAQYCLEAIRDKHNFKYIEGALEASRMSALLGNVSTQENILDALHFDLEINYTQHLSDSKHWMLEARFPVNVDAQGGSSVIVSGAGTGSLVSFNDDVGPDWYATASDFNVQAVIKEFYPCQGTAILTLDCFYPPSEDYFDTDGFLLNMSLLSIGFETVYSDYMGDSGFEFPLTLDNGNEMVSEKTIDVHSDESLEQAQGILEIRLIHTPKG